VENSAQRIACFLVLVPLCDAPEMHMLCARDRMPAVRGPRPICLFGIGTGERSNQSRYYRARGAFAQNPICKKGDVDDNSALSVDLSTVPTRQATPTVSLSTREDTGMQHEKRISRITYTLLLYTRGSNNLYLYLK
jgi:hypothetical protein